LRNPVSGVPGRADCYWTCLMYLIPFWAECELLNKDT
jgi:hypothetical protein